MNTSCKSVKKIGYLLSICCLLTLNLSAQEEDSYSKTLWTVAWSPDGNYLATGGNQNDLKLFDARTFTLLKTYPVKDVQLSRLKWHPHKNILAVITQSETFKAKLLHLDTDTWITLKNLKSSFRALDWNHSGDLLAVSELAKYVSVYSVDGTLVNRFLADPKGVAAIDWHPTKNILTTVGSRIGIYTYLGDTLTIFRPRIKEAFLLCVEWHTSGEFFAVGDYGDLKKAENKLIQFWNIEGKKRNEITGGIIEYRNIRWNPDGSKLASASEALRVWSKEGSLLAESKASDDYLWGVDWSPDGKYIVTSSKKGRVLIWDQKAKLVKTLDY